MFFLVKKNILKAFIILIIVFWLPFLSISFFYQEKIIKNIDQLPTSDVVFLLGTVVNASGDISPLLKERLEAGKRIYEEEKAQKIVVSNTENAAQVMAKYFIDAGIAEEAIEVDINAVTTLDSCRYESEKNRSVIFISQTFHLARLLYQCAGEGIDGLAFAPEGLDIIDRSAYTIGTKVQVRVKRYLREAGLTWFVLLGIY